MKLQGLNRLNLKHFVVFGLLCTVQFCLGQQSNIIYVTPGGNGAGTQASPTSLANAIANASSGKQIRLAAGIYYISSTIVMQSNLTLEGGYNPATWCKSSQNKSIIYRDSSNNLANPNRLVAIACDNINNFYIHDIDIITANAIGSGTTNYGIYLNNCSNYSIVRCKIMAGNGSDGANGLDGTNGANGANGAQGGLGDPDGPCCTAGGAGGNSWSAGAAAGGNGGNGGAQGSFNNCPNATNGQPGNGAGAGLGGNGGLGSCNFISTGCDAGPANHGQPGQNGTDGVNGTTGSNGVPSYGGGFFINGDGQAGSPGTNGSGGGGGGGGGSQGGQPTVNLFFVSFNYNGAGPGGGGGGEGGQGGSGAGGGQGGGGSFSVFAWNNGANGKLLDCTLTSGLPGIGGLGSLQGGFGGAGGAGNPVQVSQNCDLGNPGRGGNGGKGGDGGAGGNGATGVSVAVYEDPAGQALIQTNMNSPVEPEITVCDLGCTFSEYTFSTNAFGFIQWFFDGGTTPLIAYGNSVTAHFTTQGRHTITLVVNGLPYIFSEFIGIFNDGLPYFPDILTNDTIICPGQTAQFQSSITANQYNWTFEGGVPPSLSGVGFQNANSVFNNPGIYQVKLKTQSTECGWSVADSLQVEVLPILTPDVLINAAGAQVCFGDDITLGAIPIHGGNQPTYNWIVNGVNTGITNQVYQIQNATNNMNIVVQMNSNYQCPSSNSVSSLPFAIAVYPQPLLNCSYTGNYLGANTSFNVNVLGGTAPFNYFWEFGDGGISNLQNPTHLYGGTGIYNVQVSVTDANGCTGICNLAVNIIVAPLVTSNFTMNANIQCGNTLVNFTDNSTGNVTSWFWNFGDGNTSTLQNPTHNYTIPGIYTVYLVAGNGVNFDTLYMPNAVTVEALPTAGIFTAQTAGCEDFTPQFQDASIGATSWLWNFGDPGSGALNNSTLQNPYHTYENPGTYTVSLTVVNNTSGCSASVTMPNYIIVNAAPDADFSIPVNQACTGNPLQFIDQTTGNTVSWNWSFGDGLYSNSQNPSHVYGAPGVYSVALEVTGPPPTNCKNYELKTSAITVFQSPSAYFDINPFTLQLPENKATLINLSTGADNYEWNLGNGLTSTLVNPVATYKDSGVYTITLTAITNEGCTDVFWREIEVFEQEVLYIPNSFSPNGDEINDLFFTKGKGVEEFAIRIYDRWGNLMFITEDINEGWDGKTGGKDCEQGIYTYRIDYKFYRGKENTKLGSVLLMR